MNRIGFVNFWLYDEEVFEFYNGKLLLRGQNGSGKSITTQSFIPFILDGDRTPSRLDPFGSSDRRMEYYFLGEEGREEATGYLFLEFKKTNPEQYRTIGIGQRAKRGKSMDFWGFVILDGQRIGYDLRLYKETGSSKIPYDKRELKMLLGEQNIFTDSQSEYKKLVNYHIFGFPKAEQYEQFIKLLVKVRAPKLSKEFKPTKVYDILNESLQTLSDEDLRTMVDAMEKMDEIQDSLEMLNRAFADVKVIRHEYTRYNQYMIGKKAQSYSKKKVEVENVQREYDEQQKEVMQIAMELEKIVKLLEELSDRKKLVETEKNGLLDTDLEDIDRKLQRVKIEKEEVEVKSQKLEDKIEDCKEKIYQKEQELKRIQTVLEQYEDMLSNEIQELQEQQEILRWEEHEKVLRFVEGEPIEDAEVISNNLFFYRKLVEECVKILHAFEESCYKYDEIAKELELVRREKIAKEQQIVDSEKQVISSRDNWLVQLYSHVKSSEYWNPQKTNLEEVEDEIQEYQDITAAGKIQEILRNDYEKQRIEWFEKQQTVSQKIRVGKENLDAIKQELAEIQNKEDLEPSRNANVVYSRQCLKEAGIEAVPFYKTVEFSKELSDTECAFLEAQLECIGLLDALVIAEKDFAKMVQVCPEFLDTVIYIPNQGTSDFSKLVVNEDLNLDIQESTQKILSHIYDTLEVGNGIYLGEDGKFIQGVLAGRAKKEEAEFLGYLARRKKKEQKIDSLQAEIEQVEQELQVCQEELNYYKKCIENLEVEYKGIPDFEELNQSLKYEKDCKIEQERVSKLYLKLEKQEQECVEKKQAQYQMVLKKCKNFPYGRTIEEYEEALEALTEYQHTWQKCKELFWKKESEKGNYITIQDYLEQNEQILDDAFVEKRTCNVKIKECDIQIRQYEEYLNRPDIVQKAKRLKELQDEIELIQKQEKEITESRIRKEQNMENLNVSLPKKKERLLELLAEESYLRKFFEEELSLKLVVERKNKTLAECAKEAIGLLRDGDKNREYGDMLQSLIQAYQKHNGSLANYGTSLEECFETIEERNGVGEEFQPLRKRVRIVSAWGGKKVFLEEFYQILKTAIDETELLIQRKDRELFEDILSQTISQQLTDRIAESRNWVKDMSNLMKKLDTSMGLSFSLEWKPKSAENDVELDTVELEKILLRDHDLLTIEDIEKVAGHFRSKIRMEKMKLEGEGGLINYMDLVRDALDYRKWFEFRMFYKRGEENKKPLTNAAFNRFSGGEKAMAMYVPLFAAVNAQYKKADYIDHPRMVALDEAFAGVDDKNISSMFELVHKMDFDYIMNSQSLWGCYETVKGIKIAELHRPMNSQVVTVIRYVWNGHERILDVQ